jgi:hypothetical protein
MKPALTLIAVLAGLLFGLTLLSRADDDYVVIVNKANPSQSISGLELRKMFLGEKDSWASGAKVTALTPDPNDPKYALVIKKATGMSSADYKRYLIQLSFMGRVVPTPRVLETSAAIVRFVSTSPGAISCVPAAQVNAEVKRLRVE